MVGLDDSSVQAHSHTVAALGLVSPGAATDGVTLFSLEKTDDLFFVIALWKVMTFFSCRLPSSRVVYPAAIQRSF